MANRVFESLLIERVETFKRSFASLSRAIFVDPDDGQLTHPGEFGFYREAICRDFLRPVVPQRLSIGHGFLMNTADKVSGECDVIIYDPSSTPVLESEQHQRFFPVETVAAVGEVKSDLTRQKLKLALTKLSRVKLMREFVKSPVCLRRENKGAYSPGIYHYDQIFTFLVCQRFAFDWQLLLSIVEECYDPAISPTLRHNLILSIEDGLLCYFDGQGKSMMYPVHKGRSLLNRLVRPGTNHYIHFKLFASYLFLGTSSTTILYPEITDYMGEISGGMNHDQNTILK